MEKGYCDSLEQQHGESEVVGHMGMVQGRAGWGWRQAGQDVVVVQGRDEARYGPHGPMACGPMGYLPARTWACSTWSRHAFDLGTKLIWDWLQ